MKLRTGSIQQHIIAEILLSEWKLHPPILIVCMYTMLPESMIMICSKVPETNIESLVSANDPSLHNTLAYKLQIMVILATSINGTMKCWHSMHVFLWFNLNTQECTTQRNGFIYFTLSAMNGKALRLCSSLVSGPSQSNILESSDLIAMH